MSSSCSRSTVTLILGRTLIDPDGRRYICPVSGPGEPMTSIGADPVRAVDSSMWSEAADGRSFALAGFLRFMLRWRWIQPPLSRVFDFGDARSGSLFHLSRDSRNVFVKKYFLLRMYLAMASAQLWRPQNLAHCSAHSLRPLSRRFGLAPAGKTSYTSGLVSSHSVHFQHNCLTMGVFHSIIPDFL